MILKDPDVEIGVIYEAAMGEDMVVESKFLPSYNMALNLLRHRSLEEAELLMERSFGQFQRREAVRLRQAELAGLEERLVDLGRLVVVGGKRDHCKAEEVRQYFVDEVQLRNLRNRIRRLKREHWRAGGTQARPGEPTFESMSAQVEEIRARHEGSPVRRCPNLRQHRAQQAQLAGLSEEIRRSREEVEAMTHGFAEHLRTIISILEEAGFLIGLRPSEKACWPAGFTGRTGC